MQGVDEIGEALQRDIIVFAIELLQRVIGFENICKRACALQAELLV
jgi:hypothetical protein